MNEIIMHYLEQKERTSKGTAWNVQSMFEDAENVTGKELVDLSTQDIISYFRVLDDRNLAYSTKNTYRSYLNNLFEYLQEIRSLSGRSFASPMPSKKVYEFIRNRNDMRSDNDTDTLKILTKNQLQKILNLHHSNIRDRTLVILAIFTGARISELRTVRVADIRFEERYFETGFEKGARKTTMHSKKPLLFFFSERVIPFMRECIATIRECNGYLRGDLIPNHRRITHFHSV